MAALFHRPLMVAHSENATGDINIASLGNSGWQDSGLTLTLPIVGTYIIKFSLLTSFNQASVFDNLWLEGRLYNTTASALLTGSSVYLNSATNIAQNGDYFIMQGNIVCSYQTTTAPNTISLQIQKHGTLPSSGITGTYSSYGYTCFY